MRGIKKKKNILEKANVFFAKENENEKNICRKEIYFEGEKTEKEKFWRRKIFFGRRRRKISRFFFAE